ncbi:hypothetical protein [Hyphomicrobium sp. ghe19]|uniref:hypothetical protein n=1 Tax=Hyphomicrobium sp. ghe19 TaxID=2682968 RepID=UPI001367039E|nr:hypothetical protein HYPP_02530 [Hyphomicrobium sp. ghe19]
MSVKILLDPILTAAPSRCSTFIQFTTFMRRVLEEDKRTDVFFYCLLPKWDWPQEEHDWLPKHPNIVYVPVDQHKDRTREYITFRYDMLEKVAFNGTMWDWDVLVTVRSGLAALYKMHAMSPRQPGLSFTKQVWVIEDMPLMSFKKSVLQLAPAIQDRYTLDGYLAADRAVVMSYHEKDEALRVGRQWYAPSVIRELHAKLKEVVPVQFFDFTKKDKTAFFVPGKDQRFNVAYVGRLMTHMSNIDKIYKVMTNQWIIRGGDKVRMMVLTNSVGGKKKVQPPDYMEKFYASREEFWRIARDEMHVLMIMHGEAGFLLSMIEPMMLGTPAIVGREKWSVGQLGKDYPFFVDTETEAYAMLKMFYEDYAGMYERYAAWMDDWFIPTYKKRFSEDLLYDVLCNYLHEFESTVIDRYKAASPSKAENEIVKLLAKDAPEEFELLDRIAQLAESGELRSLDRKLDEDDRETRGLAWSTPWNDFRMSLKAHYGFEDASPKVGHLRKKA